MQQLSRETMWENLQELGRAADILLKQEYWGNTSAPTPEAVTLYRRATSSSIKKYVSNTKKVRTITPADRYFWSGLTSFHHLFPATNVPFEKISLSASSHHYCELQTLLSVQGWRKWNAILPQIW